jgi:hypothetical protein
MRIKNTQVDTTQDWPADIFIQGGSNGLVIGNGTKESYTTAFVEVAPDKTFIRGEGSTITEAEEAAWVKYQSWLECTDHIWETRGYTNGAGFCTKCKGFQSHTFTGEELGQLCVVCGVGCLGHRWSDKAYRNPEGGFPQTIDLDKEKAKWYCDEHNPFPYIHEEIDLDMNALTQLLLTLGGGKPDEIEGAMKEKEVLIETENTEKN